MNLDNEFDDIDDAFTGTNGDSPTKHDDEGQDYTFPNVGEWVTHWFAPATALKLSDGGRGRVWCKEWFLHPPVVVRLDSLWRAWEKATRSGDDKALDAWFVYSYDATVRELTNGEHGPMHACSPSQHREVPSLPVDPVPDGFFAPTSTSHTLLRATDLMRDIHEN